MRRRVRRTVLSALLAAAVGSALVPALTGGSTATAAPKPAPKAAPEYYLALGDSLALGVQPDAAGKNAPTTEGYVDKLFARAKVRYPALELVKLGCDGETSASMVTGGVCTYQGHASQLAAAEAFLKANRGKVRFVTLDIGARDVYGCITPQGAEPACLLKGVGTVGLNLPKIASRLRLAAGLGTRIVGMNYYNPALAAWITGAEGQAKAKQSQLVAGLLNTKLAVNYGFWGFRIADVAKTFRSGEFSPTVPTFLGDLPMNVFMVVAHTWVFSNTPGNFHPRAQGYDLIADTFVGHV